MRSCSTATARPPSTRHWRPDGTVEFSSIGPATGQRRPLDRMEVLAARFVADRPHVEVVSPDFAEICRALEKLSDGVLGTLSSDEAGRRWIPTFVHDRDPGVTWFYDHATGEARLLFPLPPPQPHGPGPR